MSNQHPPRPASLASALTKPPPPLVSQSPRSQDRVRTPPPSINNPLFPAPVVHNPVAMASLLPSLDSEPAPSTSPSVYKSVGRSAYHSAAESEYQSAAETAVTHSSAPAAKKVRHAVSV